MEKKRKNLIIVIFSIFLFAALLLYFLKVPSYYPKKINSEFSSDFFGVTYSKKYARELGLEWKEAYLDILEDLKVKQVRIPVYWDEIEEREGIFDFSDYIFMIEEGEKRGVEFILNFGMRTPRWPECHIPVWIDISDIPFLQDKTIVMIKEVLNTFKEYDSIVYWQLENEPLLNTFGICPKADYDFLKKEFEIVKTIDSRPVIISSTGELSLWQKEMALADIFGTTMYRVVNNSFFGYLRYPYPAGFYRTKANALNANFDNIFIVELQAEPWVPVHDLVDIENRDYLKSFDIDQFRANLQFAYNTNFKKAYLWGVEWWYFRDKVAGDSSYWNLAKTLFN